MKVLVREVSSKGESSLVEWTDEQTGSVSRTYIPSTQLIHEEGQVFVDNPEEGAPYGEAWEELVHTKYGPKGIAGLLRQNGIWTYEDFLRNTPVVNSVFREACTLNYQEFVDRVHQRQNVKEEGRIE